MMKQLIMIAMLAALTLSVLTSCGESKEKLTFTELADWREYTLVRAEIADPAVVDAAVKLNKVFEEKYANKMPLKTDWVKRSEEIPVGTKEIIIGKTNRPESEMELAYLDYAVKFENNRLVITGGSGEAVGKAVDWFIETCMGETISVPDSAYIVTETYPMAEMTVGGVPLSSYFAKPADVDYDAIADSLNAWIATGTGITPTKDSGHIITLTANASLDVLEYSMSAKDGNILLESAVGGIGVEAVVELFKEIAAAASNNVLELPGVKTAEVELVSMATEAQMTEWRKMTDERIGEIRNTPNMEIPAGSTVFYLSPNGNDANDGKSPEKAWKTLERLNKEKLNAGSYVCFERGGMWRGQVTVFAGVTYTAYGEGPKPELRGSTYDGAVTGSWEEVEKNIWRYSEKFPNDVGTLVMNHGEEHAIKITLNYAGDVVKEHVGGKVWNGITNLDVNNEFYHDLGGMKVTNPDGGYIYLYCDKGNPAEVWDSIEFVERGSIFGIGRKDKITIDNLCIKYSNFGVSSGRDDLTVQNCEFGWIGGSLQLYSEAGVPTRYGNAIEIYGSCDRFNVTDNYISQVYDAGITQQSRVSDDVSIPTDKLVMMKKMNYARNVLEYCNYSIEYFLSRLPEDNPSRMEGFLIEDNISWYPGEGLCEQRPDPSGAHIRSSGGSNRAIDFVIRNNLWIGNNVRFYYISSDRYNPDGSDSMPELSGNIYVGGAGKQFGLLAMDVYTMQTYGLNIADYLAEHSDGTEQYLFIKDWHIAD